MNLTVSLAAVSQQGVEQLLKNMHDEFSRNMLLMGCKNIKDLDRSKIIIETRKVNLNEIS